MGTDSQNLDGKIRTPDVSGQVEEVVPQILTTSVNLFNALIFTKETPFKSEVSEVRCKMNKPLRRLCLTQ